MNENFFKKFCGVSLSLQFLFFILNHYAVINYWDFPAVLFMLATIFLGGIGAFFGIAQAVKNKGDVNPGRNSAIAAYFLCIFTVTTIEIVYGWNNIDLSAANDYSTDLMTPPQFNQSKHERLLAKESSELLGFMDIPHKVRQAETESLILLMSGFDSKILIKQAINKLGWVFLRRSDDASTDKVFNETYQVKGGITGIIRRTDVAVRIISANAGESIIDIRASSPNSRRDFGFNELVIKELFKELRELEAL
jgi:hypothetical protein